MENRQISINVGGQVFYTSMAVLRSIPHSLLADLCDPSVTLEEAMDFPEKGFRHGTGSKDLKTYDTSPDMTSMGLGVKEIQAETSGDRNTLKEKLNRAKFVYLSSNSYLRKARKKSAPTASKFVSSPSSSSSSPESPSSSFSHPSNSPRVMQPDPTDVSPMPSLTWSTSTSCPPPYRAAMVTLYYPLTNALHEQDDKLVLSGHAPRPGRGADRTMAGATENTGHIQHRKSYIDNCPPLDVTPQHDEPVPSQPIYIDRGQMNPGFQTMYEDSGVTDSLSSAPGYTSGQSRPGAGENFSVLGESCYLPATGRQRPTPHGCCQLNTQTSKQTTHSQYQQYPPSDYQQKHHYPPQHQQHQEQQQQEQQHQQELLFKIYQHHQEALIPLPFASAGQADIYVDRNPYLMPFILDAYRIGQLHLPSNICSLSVRAELDFWKLSEDLICECCWMNYQQGLKTMGVVNTICRAFYSLYDDPRARAALSWTGKIWLVLERPSYNWMSKVWCGIYFFCIVLSCILFGLITVSDFTRPKEEFRDKWDAFQAGNNTFRAVHMVTFSRSVESLEILEMSTSVFFTLELLARLVTCPNKRAFLLDFHNIIDVFILVVQWSRDIIDHIISNDVENFSYARSYVLVVFYCLLSFRVLRVFHLAKPLSTLRIMYLSTKESSKELFLLVVTLAAGVLLFGTALFLVEAISLPETNHMVFSNIPAAMWWAVITLTTVGYGDYVPEHTAGYLIGSACAIVGLLLVAMPIAIVASNFSSYHDNMTSRDQSIRRGRLMDRIKHLRTERARRANMAARELQHGRRAEVAGVLLEEDRVPGGGGGQREARKAEDTKTERGVEEAKAGEKGEKRVAKTVCHSMPPVDVFNHSSSRFDHQADKVNHFPSRFDHQAEKVNHSPSRFGQQAEKVTYSPSRFDHQAEKVRRKKKGNSSVKKSPHNEGKRQGNVKLIFVKGGQTTEV